MLRPPRLCSTFGVSDRMRVPAPAARTRTAESLLVVMGLLSVRFRARHADVPCETAQSR
jgi:hypothetical protein